MSEPSIYDGLRYLYAEQLQGRRVTLTIKEVLLGVEFTSADGRKAKGFDVLFVETEKVLGVTSVTVTRQLGVACGTAHPQAMAGKKVTLYPERSRRSLTGWAIRVAPPDRGEGG